MKTTLTELADGPSFPYLRVGPRGEVELCEADTPLNGGSLYALVRGHFSGLIAYDSESRWRVAEVIAPYRITFWTRLLANTIYNPQIRVTLRWQRVSDYNLSDLQEVLCCAVDHDADILAQHHNPARLKKLIRLCKSYEQLTTMLRKYPTLHIL